MAQFELDFSAETVGNFPSVFTSRWAAFRAGSGINGVVASSGRYSGADLTAMGTKLFRYAGDAFARNGAEWVSGSTDDTVYATLWINADSRAGTTGYIPALILRGGGTSESNRVGYSIWIRPGSGNYQIRKATGDGSDSALATGTLPSILGGVAAVEFKAYTSGSNVVLEAKAWDYFGTKPSTPDLTHTDTSPLSVGWIGVGGTSQAAFESDFGFIGAGTNGDAAPNGQAGGTTIDAVGVVAASAGMGMSAEVTAAADMAMGASHSATQEGQAAAQGQMTTAAQAGTTMQARADFLASITAAATHGQSMTGAVEAVSEIQADMVVSATVSATATAEAQALAEMVAGVQGALSMFTGTQIDASMSVGASANVGMTATIQANVDMAVSGSASTSATGAAQATADIQVSAQAASQIIAQAATQAGISVGYIHNVTITESSISGDVVTPDRRTYRIELELRTLTVPAEDRTYTVH